MLLNYWYKKCTHQFHPGSPLFYLPFFLVDCFFFFFGVSHALLPRAHHTNLHLALRFFFFGFGMTLNEEALDTETERKQHSSYIYIYIYNIYIDEGKAKKKICSFLFSKNGSFTLFRRLQMNFPLLPFFFFFFFFAASFLFQLHRERKETNK